MNTRYAPIPWIIATLVACGGDDGAQPAVGTLALQGPARIEATATRALEPVDLAAIGGRAPFLWSVTDGAWPTGMELIPSEANEGRTARVRGTPEEAGNWSLTVAVQDSSGKSASWALEVRVGPAQAPLSIATEALPDAGLHVPYEAVLSATGGSEANYVWSIVRGSLPSGLRIAPVGTPDTELSGTASEIGNYGVTIEVRDDAGNTARRAFELRVVSATEPLSIQTIRVPDAQATAPYEAEISATGGTGFGYAWTIVDGALPEGVTLSKDGTPAAKLSGAPEARGTYTFEIRVEDSAGNQSQREYQMIVGDAPPPLQITTTALPAGQVGELYLASIRSINGHEPVRWSLRQGTLPAGLELNEEGSPNTSISGTPTEAGKFSLTIRAEDATGHIDQGVFELNIEAVVDPLEITTSELPSASVAETYEATLTAQGGIPPYHWIVEAGALPPGLNLQVAGTPDTRITGFAGAGGTFSATIAVYDARNVVATRFFELEIEDNALPLRILTRGLPAATQCAGYGARIEAADGSRTEYQWQVVRGELPPGLELEPEGTPSVGFTGVPNQDARGSYGFTVQVSDPGGRTAEQNFRVNVERGEFVNNWVVVAGALEDSGYNAPYLANACAASGVAAPTRLFPENTSGTLTTGALLFDFSPDQSMFAFVGSYDGTARDVAYVAPIVNGAPTAPQAVSTGIGATAVADQVLFSPDSTKLAFTASYQGGRNLYVVDVTNGVIGTPHRVNAQLTARQEVKPTSFRFSPDGRFLAYVAEQNFEYRDEVFVVDVSGAMPGPSMATHAPVSVDFAGAGTLQWSPDGQYLVFDGDLETSYRIELWASRFNGTTFDPAVRVHAPMPSFADIIANSSSDPRQSRAFQWSISPTTNHLVFSHDAASDNFVEPYLVDLNNIAAGPVRLTRTGERYGRPYFSWSPDGSKVFYALQNGTQRTIRMIDVAAGAPYSEQVLTPRMGNGSGAVAGGINGIKVAPSGEYVLFRADMDVPGINELYLLDLRTPGRWTTHRVNEALLAARTSVWAYYISPDSRYVAYVADPTSGARELFISEIVNGVPSPAARVNSPVGGPSQGVSNGPNDVLFLHGSAGLVYRSDERVDGQSEAWFVSLGQTPLPAPVAINPPLPGQPGVQHIFSSGVR